jgi:hypothetical protein
MNGIDDLAAAAAAGGQDRPQQVPIPPRETTYPAILGAAVEDGDGVRVLTLHSALPREVLHIVFPKANAEEIGKKLAAPSVVIATPETPR